MSALLQALRKGRLVRTLDALAHCRRGVAAVEFAMIVPIMLMLFVGAIQFSQAITVDRRVTQVASSTADLVARNTAVTTTQLDGYMKIVSQLLAPYSATPLKLTLLNVYQKASPSTDTNAYICWHYNYQGGTATYTDGSTYTIPTGILSAGNSVVVAEVNYSYTPLLMTNYKAWFDSSVAIPMNEKFYLKPRLSASIQFNSAAACL